jgi:hypothetical protein
VYRQAVGREELLRRPAKPIPFVDKQRGAGRPGWTSKCGSGSPISCISHRVAAFISWLWNIGGHEERSEFYVLYAGFIEKERGAPIRPEISHQDNHARTAVPEAVSGVCKSIVVTYVSLAHMKHQPSFNIVGFEQSNFPLQAGNGERMARLSGAAIMRNNRVCHQNPGGSL